MQGAAAEGARLMTTISATGTIADGKALGSSEFAIERVVRSRLQSVPNVSIFHIGGDEGWHINLSGGGDSSTSSATIEHSIKPLPFIGALFMPQAERDSEGNVRVRVFTEMQTRPSWMAADANG